MIVVLVILSVKRSYYNASLNVEKLTSSILKLLVILFRSEFMLKVILTLQLVWEYVNEIHLAFTGLSSNLLSSQDNSVFPIFYFRFPIFGYWKLEIPFFVKVIWGIPDF